MKRNKAFKVLPVLASALVLSLVAACGNSGMGEKDECVV